MAQLLLQRPLDADIIGTHLSASYAAITTRADGVSLCSTETLALLSTHPIGAAGEQLEARAVVCEDAGLLCAVLSDPKTQHQCLVTCPITAPATATTPQRHTLPSAGPRIVLPSGTKLHSLHVLQPPHPAQQQPPRKKKLQAPPPSCIALVLKQGQVAWALPSGEDLQLHLLPAAPHVNIKAATSLNSSLATLAQASPGADAQLQLFTWKDSALTPLSSRTAPCPSASASATNLCLAPSYALISWSDASVSVLPLTPFTAAPLHVRLADVAQQAPDPADQGQPSTSHAATADAPSSQRKKRRPGQDPEPSRPAAPLVAAFDETQFIVAWPANAPPAQGGSGSGSSKPASVLHFVLVGVKLGLSVSRGSVPLGLPFSPTARCSLSMGSAGLLLLQVGGAVLGLRLEAPAANLLSLVGKLSLSPQAQAPDAASSGAVWSMNLKALVQPAAGEGSGGGSGLLAPAPAAALIEREAAAEGRQLQEQLELAARAASSSGAGAPRPERQQLHQRALEYALRAQQQPVRRLRSELLPTRLLTLLAQGLADTEQWPGLEQLLLSTPLQGLQGCSGLLPAITRAHQYQLLASLCCKLDEVQAADVAGALASLLGATSEANLGARRAYYQHLRSHAEAAVAQSEAAVARSYKSRERRDAVAFAQCAAAAVDGFSYREVLLHPLLAVPVDAPALQTCLARLDNTLVDRLLTYLAKWMDKYAHKLGEGAAAVALPQELLFPTQPQVLDWVRLVLDAHLARLMMSAGGGELHVSRLAGSLKLQLAACQQLLPLLGTAEHIRHQAPLPAAHVAAATQYTVELLDLSIRS